MYLHPPELDELGIKSDRVQIERNDEKAMAILQQYHSKIDTAQVMLHCIYSTVLLTEW